MTDFFGDGDIFIDILARFRELAWAITTVYDTHSQVTASDTPADCTPDDITLFFFNHAPTGPGKLAEVVGATRVMVRRKSRIFPYRELGLIALARLENPEGLIAQGQVIFPVTCASHQERLAAIGILEPWLRNKGLTGGLLAKYLHPEPIATLPETWPKNDLAAIDYVKSMPHPFAGIPPRKPRQRPSPRRVAKT